MNEPVFAVIVLAITRLPLLVKVPLNVTDELLTRVPPILIVVELTVVLAVSLKIAPLGIITSSYVPGIAAPTQAAVVFQVNEPVLAVIVLLIIIEPLLVTVPLSVTEEFLTSIPPVLIVVELTVVLAVSLIIAPLGIITSSYVPGTTPPTHAAVVFQVNEPVFALMVLVIISEPLFVTVPPRVILELLIKVPPLLIVVERTVVLVESVIVEPLGIITSSFVPGTTPPTHAATAVQEYEPVFAVIVFVIVIVPLFVTVPPSVTLELRISVPPLLIVVE